MKFIFEMKEFKNHRGFGGQEVRGLESIYLLLQMCIFFFFKKFPMNEYEEVKHLGIIHILLQVERAWLWSLFTIFGQEMLEIQRFLPYSNANSFSENLVINQTMLQSLFLRKKKKDVLKCSRRKETRKIFLTMKEIDL